MDNRIHHLEVLERSLDPIAAEVWISVLPEQQTAATEVRGRLMGPRCLYASTVEVAYPFRPLSTHQNPSGLPGLTVRTVIPEASLWEPQSPFLYQGPIELWQDGRCCDRVILSHGLRSLKRNEHSLSVNGKPLTLHGRRITACSDEDATKLRQSGYNLLIAPVTQSSLVVWEQADRFGFLVLGQLSEDAGQMRLMEILRRHASYLGWLSAECRAFPAEEAVAWFMARERSEPLT